MKLGLAASLRALGLGGLWRLKASLFLVLEEKDMGKNMLQVCNVSHYLSDCGKSPEGILLVISPSGIISF